MRLSMTEVLKEGKIAEENSKGKMIAFYIPVSLAKKLKVLGNPYKGEALKLSDMHITLGLIHIEDNSKRKDIENCLKLASQYIDPFEIKIDSIGLFPPGPNSNGMQVLHALPKSEAFSKIHELVFQIFEKFEIPIDNGSFDFKPHITIKYCSPGQEINTDSMKIDEETEITEISFANSGKVKDFKLGN